MREIEQAYKKALDVLRKCSTKHGLYASGGKKGYKGVWARDSMISLIGASANKTNFIKNQFKKSLSTLAKYQSKHGEIANAVLKLDEKKPKIDYLSIDSSLWFALGCFVYKKRYKDALFCKKIKPNVDRAVTWLSYHDLGEDTLLEQLPTTDWQDAFPHKYGRVISTEALYYKILNLYGKKKDSEKLKRLVNEDKEVRLWNNDFYYAYRWKNHGQYKEIGEWFDSLGNLLTIVFELAPKERAEKIIKHIKNKRINEPYPAKAIFPPIKKGDKYWQDYFQDCDAKRPFHYLNAGIWTYIGGFYILALIKLKKFKEAEEELKKLAEANLKGNFPEWINPITKSFHGGLQAWSAGMYISAYESLKKKKVLF